MNAQPATLAAGPSVDRRAAQTDDPAASPAADPTADPTADHAADHAIWAAALRDPEQPVPAGWIARNGSDPAPRFAVHRNTYVVSLIEALADGFPVVRRVLGAERFTAWARAYVAAEPPASPCLHDWGDGVAAALAGVAAFAPHAGLASLAALERARVQACHAADAERLSPAAALAAAPAADALVDTRLRLHPSLRVVQADHDVVAWWAAAQDDDAALPSTATPGRCAALVLRDPDDAVLVVPVPAPVGAAIADLTDGRPLGAALQAAGLVDGDGPQQVLLPLLQHQALSAWLSAWRSAGLSTGRIDPISAEEDTP